MDLQLMRSKLLRAEFTVGSLSDDKAISTRLNSKM